MKEYIFEVAGIKVGLKVPFCMTVSENFQPFYIQGKPDYVAEFEEAAELPKLQARYVYEDMGFDVILDQEHGVWRCFRDRQNHNIRYAMSYCDWKSREVRVQYIREGLPCIDHTDGAFFHIAWEEMLLREKRMIFHACFVNTPLGGLLFSGDSGIGKSTQGALWCRYEGAELINGDRPILSKSEDGWIAYGSPYAGSSKCHVNRHAPVKAVIMLQKAQKCSIRRLDVTEAFRKIFAQVTVSPWASDNVAAACSMTEQLTADLTVYELACTPDENAVKLLKNTLLRQGG